MFERSAYPEKLTLTFAIVMFKPTRAWNYSCALNNSCRRSVQLPTPA